VTADYRLAKLPIEADHQHSDQGGNRAAQKDVKYEGRSGNVYENKGSDDTMTDNYSGFCAWLASFSRKWTAIHRSFGGKYRDFAMNWDEAGPKNLHIGPSIYRLSTESFLDSPMIR
jgi:hypothetical protein